MSFRPSLERQEVDKLLDPAFVENLDSAPIGDVRTKRDECRRVEDLVSYLRRVMQGQIDLVTAELEMRAGGAGGDPGRLVEDLPAILSGGRATGTGRPAGTVIAPAPPSEAFGDTDELNWADIASALSPESAPGDMFAGANLGSLRDTELVDLLDQLGRHEAELSAKRRILHERIDQLTATMVERYKSGAAKSDTLLVDNNKVDNYDSLGSDSH